MDFQDLSDCVCNFEDISVDIFSFFNFNVVDGIDWANLWQAFDFNFFELVDNILDFRLFEFLGSNLNELMDDWLRSWSLLNGFMDINNNIFLGSFVMSNGNLFCDSGLGRLANAHNILNSLLRLCFLD